MSLALLCHQIQPQVSQFRWDLRFLKNLSPFEIFAYPIHHYLQKVLYCTFINLKVNEITRMKAPYKSKCMDSWEQSGYKISSNYSYSVSYFYHTLEKILLETLLAMQHILPQSSHNPGMWMSVA